MTALAAPSAAALFTLAEVARRLGGRVDGDPGIMIEGVGSLRDATEHEAAVLFDERHTEEARSCAAAVLIAAEGVDLGGRPSVRVAEPRAALIELLELFHPPPPARHGVEPGATISPRARIDPSAWIAAGARIEEEARVGAGVEVHAHAVVGRGSTIGAGSVLHHHVVLYPGTEIGERVEIHAGSVLGRPGFGYRRDADGRQRRIPQVGRVIIEDDVEIGALCAIDRATLGATIVRRGTKIDNLVQIGHNSEVGEDCCVVAQVGISGSVRIGAGSVLGGQSGVADHAVLDAGTVVSAKSGAVGRLTGGEWIGLPALPGPRGRRVYGLLPRLPELYRELRRLRAEVAALRGALAERDE
jgi:UDP-3-O-[3-hydroxymyristoyl] glucosamine N-acyltransferase